MCAIYQYIQLSDSIAAFTRLNQTCAQPVAQAKEALHETGNGALWLFTSAQEKQRVSGAYRYLNDLLTGEYGQTARQCTGTSAVAVTANQAWEHFAQNTVRYYNVLEEVAPGNLGNDTRDCAVSCAAIRSGASNTRSTAGVCSSATRWVWAKPFRRSP